MEQLNVYEWGKMCPYKVSRPRMKEAGMSTKIIHIKIHRR